MNPIIDQLKSGIASVESQGKYDALGKATSTGDKAYGKYQVMGANIPSWTKEATGTSATPDEFLSNPDLQEKVATHRVGELYKQYGNPSDVASAWFTGGPLKKNANKQDVNKTSDTSYVSKVLAYITGAKTAEASTGDTTTPNNATTDFAEKIKTKYPQYKDIPDDELTKKILDKYPQYKDMVSGSDSSSPYASTGGHHPFATNSESNTPENNTPTSQPNDTLSTAANISKGLLNYTGGNDIADALAATNVKANVLNGTNGAVEADYSKLTPAAIEKLKSEGVPTTLQGQREETAATVKAPTKGAVAKDILRTGASIAGLIAGGGALNSLTAGGTALGSEAATSAISDYLGAGETASGLSSAQKAEAISNALNGASAGDKVVLNKALQELAPNILKEAGVGSFSDLNPKTAKVLGVTWKSLKAILKIGLAGAGFEEGGQFVKGILGQK